MQRKYLLPFLALSLGAAGLAGEVRASVPTHPGGIVALTRLGDHLPPAAAADRNAARAFLDERVAPHFDFDVMARRTAGPFYHRFTPTEREAFTARLRALFIEALAGNLTSGTPAAPRVDVYPTRFLRWGDEASVLARVTSSPSAPIWMTFRFHRTPGGWKAFDAAANGFSAVSHFRAYFAALARRYGPEVLHRPRMTADQPPTHRGERRK